MKYAPIALFAYKRVDKLTQCIEALSRNKDVDKTDLFIFSDGYKDEKDRKQVENVRKYIKFIAHEQVFASVNIIERSYNWGLANSIINGVTEVIKEYGKVIVVEDDLITTPDFIQYMNDALEYYDQYQQYGSVSAYTYPISGLKRYKKDVYVTRKGECWGWGTWKDRWEDVDWLVGDFDEYLTNRKERKRFDSLEKGLDNMLVKQMNGELDSWAVRWCYHLFKKGLLTVYPTVSKTKNVGLDGSGTHCSVSGDCNQNIQSKGTYKLECLGVNKKLERQSARYMFTMSLVENIKMTVRKKMILRMINELIKYGIVTTIQHVRMVLTKSREASYAYYSSIHKNKSLKELEVELEKEFKNCNFYNMDFSNPQTYCQKVYWLRLYGATPLKTKLADKYLCREYIRSVVGEQYNVPLLGVWNEFNEINFEKLPAQFVLKTNHGCGFNIVIRDKKSMNKSEIKRQLDSWMKMNYALFFCEMQYYNIPRKIIAEQYLEQLDGGLYDYKFHCFNGEPLFCELIGERDLELSSAKQAIYDCKWNFLEFTFGDYEQFEHLVDEPKCLNEMVEVARRLSAGIDYVRVDLYVIEEKVYVGELTFTSGGGNAPNISPKNADLELGRMIHLDAPYYIELGKM